MVVSPSGFQYNPHLPEHDLRVRRCALLHEFIYWAHWDTSKRGITAPASNTTRRETGLKLVDPLEYQTAETTYEGDAYQIACELDMTLQVIQTIGLKPGCSNQVHRAANRLSGRHVLLIG